MFDRAKYAPDFVGKKPDLRNFKYTTHSTVMIRNLEKEKFNTIETRKHYQWTLESLRHIISTITLVPLYCSSNPIKHNTKVRT